jgi:hypothetical protein
MKSVKCQGEEERVDVVEEIIYIGAECAGTSGPAPNIATNNLLVRIPST